MSRPDLATDEQIKSALRELPLWKREGNALVREFVAPNFPAAVGMLNAIAIIAEKADHHPDIMIYGWNKLRVTTSTHDKGGLTKLDFDLAKKIEELKY